MAYINIYFLREESRICRWIGCRLCERKGGGIRLTLLIFFDVSNSRGGAAIYQGGETLSVE